MTKKKSTVKGFLLGAIIGATVGSVATILYAPQNTKEMKRKLERKSRKFKEGAQKALEKAQIASKDLRIKEKISDVAQLIKTFQEESSEKVVPTDEQIEAASNAEKEIEPTQKKESKKTRSSPHKKRRFFKGI